MKEKSLFIFLLFLPCILLCFLSEELVVIIYGEGKVELALFVIPLATFWVFRSVGGALVPSITQGLGKTKIDFYWNLSVLGLFGLVSLILAPYGALGPCCSTGRINEFCIL